MIKERLPVLIEDRIKRRERRGRNVRVGNSKALFFKAGTGKEVSKPLTSGEFKWQCVSFSEEKYFAPDVNTAISRNSLTDNHTESGNGVYDPTTGIWSGTGKTWTLNEWANHYLKVGDNYYKILSNDTATPGILILDVGPEQIISDGAYNIYPFTPNMFKGFALYPDDNSDRFYKVQNNSNTQIFINPRVLVYDNLVTTGDAAGDYDTFRSSSHTGYPNDHWNDYTLQFIVATNLGDSSNIADFVGATGEFVLETPMDDTIDINDEFIIEDGLLWVGVGATYQVASG